MDKSCSVVDELQRIMTQTNGFEVKFPKTGDTLSFSKWGDFDRKSYVIALAKDNSNDFKSIGTIKEDNLKDIREFFDRLIGEQE